MNIEEFRASVTAKRDLSRRMAVLAEQARAAKSWHYHRGRAQAYSKVLEMLADVDLNPWNVGHLDPEPGDEVPASFDCPVCKKHVNGYHVPGVSLSCKLIDPNIRSAP